MLHFSRFEFKYVLDRARRERVEADLRHFVELDPHVLRAPDHVYFVRSLYFDDAALSAYHAKCDGLLTRAKFRLRTYGRQPGLTQRFLEIKGRDNHQVWKHRAPVGDAGDPNARGNTLVRQLLEHAAAGRVRDEFAFQVFRRGIAPIALVDYVRRPYLSRFDPDFRLTFDSELIATATDTLFPNGSSRPVPMLPGHSVMEVKFRHHVPAWFHHILQAHELRRTTISKICAACEHLGLTDVPRAANLASEHAARPWLRG